MARGVRREKSRLAGGIELFAVSDVVITQGKGDLGILTSARLVVFYRHIMDDYDRMQFAYEVVKQVARAADLVDGSEWYDVLAEVLQALNIPAISLQLAQTWFYMRYAALLGYELSVVNDIDGQLLQSDKLYSYDVGEKGLRETMRGELGADHIKFLRLVSSKPLSAVAQIGGVEAILPSCWRTTRQHAGI
jgi:recombinational DNA repair protein (RecF pathway)